MPTAVLEPESDLADGREDFDFFLGRWWVRHRRLRRRLEGCDRWDEFGGTCETRAILGGLGNVDDNLIDLPGDSYRAATVRLFDPATRQWSIRWIDARKPSVQPPVLGGFDHKDGIGTFFGDDTFAGRAIRVRFVWSAITAISARWEQAFSADGGASWERNWIMQFQRAG